MSAITGSRKNAFLVGSTFSEPPTSCQLLPSKRRILICDAVPFDSCQPTKGTPPTLATLAPEAFLIVSKLSEPLPTVTQELPSKRLTRIWLAVPSDSRHAT